MKKRSNFLQQLERRRQTHLVSAPSHVDKPSEQTLEQLEAERARLEVERTKAEIDYWQGRQQANTGGDEPVFGLASNNRKFFRLPKRKRPQWK